MKIRIYRKLGLFIIAIIVAKQAFSGTCVIEPVAGYSGKTPGAAEPQKQAVANAQKSICIIKTEVNGNVKGKATGVLIANDLVATAMHTFVATATQPIMQPQNIKVAFGVVNGDMSNITNWIDVAAIEPVISNENGNSSYLDFVVLKLKTDATQKGGTPVGVHWEWGKNDEDGVKAHQLKSKRGFLLHHPHVMSGSTIDFNKIEMSISYRSVNETSEIRPNCFLDALHPIMLDWPVYKEFPGSSGGGLFDDDGKLLGIIKGRPYSDNYIKEANKYVHIIPIDYIIDKDKGSSSARAEFSKNNLTTVPGAFNHFFFSVWHNAEEYMSSPPNSIHSAPVWQHGGQSLSFDLADGTSGSALTGYYKLKVICRISFNAASDLCDNGDLSVIKIGAIGERNSIEGKNKIFVSDITSDICPGTASEAIGEVEITAKITDPNNIQLTFTADDADNSVYQNSTLGALFSVGGMAVYRDKDIEGRKVTSSGGGVKRQEWFLSAVLQSSQVAAGIYVTNPNTNIAYTMVGELVPNLSGGTILREKGYCEAFNASLVGGDHYMTSSSAGGTVTLYPSNLLISWGDETSTARMSYDAYVGNVHSHRYFKSGDVTIKVYGQYSSGQDSELASIPINIEPYPDVPDPIMIPVQSLLVGKTEVTQGEYFNVLGIMPAEHYYMQSTKRPVEKVTWYDAIIFCNTKSQKEGLESVYTYNSPEYEGPNCTNFSNFSADLSKNGFRLPTEDEWYLMFRAGIDDGDFDFYKDISWLNDNSNGKTHTVAQKAANPFGFCDVIGNVSEWLFDEANPGNGSWEKLIQSDYTTEYLPYTMLLWTNPVYIQPNVGFRIVRNAPPAPVVSVNAAYLFPEPEHHYASLPQRILFRSFEDNLGGPLSWVIWDFGDSAFSTDRWPKHEFNTPGIHDITVWGIGLGGKSIEPTVYSIDIGDMYYEQHFDYWDPQPPTNLSEWLLNDVSYMSPVNDDDGSSLGSHYKSTYLKTTSPGGWDALSKFETSKFEANRTIGSGIEVKWKLRFASPYDPLDYGNQWRENNKVWIFLCDDYGKPLYELMMKPNRLQDQYTSFDLEFAKIVDGTRTVISQGWTHQLTPYGPDAPFVGYTWTLNEDGGVFVNYDNGTSIAPNYLYIQENTHQRFSKLRFQYKTGTEDKNYMVQIDDIELRYK